MHSHTEPDKTQDLSKGIKARIEKKKDPFTTMTKASMSCYVTVRTTVNASGVRLTHDRGTLRHLSM